MQVRFYSCVFLQEASCIFLIQDQVLLLCPHRIPCFSPNIAYIILYGHFLFSCLPSAVLYIGGRSFDNFFYRGFILFVCGVMLGELM